MGPKFQDHSFSGPKFQDPVFGPKFQDPVLVPSFFGTDAFFKIMCFFVLYAYFSYKLQLTYVEPFGPDKPKSKLNTFDRGFFFEGGGGQKISMAGNQFLSVTTSWP